MDSSYHGWVLKQQNGFFFFFFGDAPSPWPEQSRQAGCSDGQWELSSPRGYRAGDGAVRAGGNWAAGVRAGEADPEVLLGKSVRLHCQIPA